MSREYYIQLYIHVNVLTCIYVIYNYIIWCYIEIREYEINIRWMDIYDEYIICTYTLFCAFEKTK